MFGSYISILLQSASDGEPSYIVALACVVIASILALVVNIALAYRIRKIAPPPPDAASPRSTEASQEKEAERRDRIYRQ